MTDGKVSVDVRLSSIRAADAILAALQATFALPQLIDGGNPFRFLPEDPQNSKLWICDPESKLQYERGGSRAMILVERLDYTPSNLHLQNFAGGDMHETTEYSDLGTTMVVITCEGGNKYQSEMLGSIVYQIIKRFRLDLMREFDLHTIIPVNVSRVSQIEQAQGSPWVTTVTLRVETQERFNITEIANQLNHVQIARFFKTNLEKRKIDQLTVTLDGGAK